MAWVQSKIILVIVVSWILILGLLGGIVPVSAGEITAPLHFSAPRAVGLGNGWHIFDTLPTAGNRHPRLNCRTATRCSGVRWNFTDRRGVQLGIYGVRSHKGTPRGLKNELKVLRRESVAQGIKVVSMRTGDYRSYKFTGKFTSGPYLGQRARFVYTTYRWLRVATMGLQGQSKFFNSKKRNLSVSKMIAYTTKMANPLSGKVSRSGIKIR